MAFEVVFMLIVKAKIKEYTKQFGDYSIASDVSEALEEKAKQLLKDACDRAKANNRRTVMGRDI